MSSFSGRRSFLLQTLGILTGIFTAGRSLDLRALAASAGSVSTRLKKHYLLNAEQEEGPFYIDHSRVRNDISEGKAGIPVTLRIKIIDPTLEGAPVKGCAVDIWHCDSVGEYSGFMAMNLPPRMPPPPGHFGEHGGGGGPEHGPGHRTEHVIGHGPDRGPANEKRFLRGVQISNEDGIVEFHTIYPGWYVGRAIHIHLKVHVGFDTSARDYSADHVAHTGQLFFPETISDEVMKVAPYATHKGERTRQNEDFIFQDEHGEQSMLGLKRCNGNSIAGGFVATVTLGVDPNATPKKVGIF